MENAPYIAFFIVFAIAGGFVVGCCNPKGMVAGIILGALAGALLSLPVIEWREQLRLGIAFVAASTLGGVVGTATPESNRLKRMARRLGLTISIGGSSTRKD